MPHTRPLPAGDLAFSKHCVCPAALKLNSGLLLRNTPGSGSSINPPVPNEASRSPDIIAGPSNHQEDWIGLPAALPARERRRSTSSLISFRPLPQRSSTRKALPPAPPPHRITKLRICGKATVLGGLDRRISALMSAYLQPEQVRLDRAAHLRRNL